jgi:hypothetical protein
MKLMPPAPRPIHAPLLAALASATLFAGCASMPFGSTKSDSGGSTAAAAPAPAAAPAVKSTAGMNAQGEVVDSKKVEAGSGQRVKGLNDWEGEITGKPAPGSKFTQLKIGMGLRQVYDLVGQPSDQGAYLTGKAWIPFYFGADKHRHEMVYKGMGRLIFASSGGFDFSSGNLIWIIHNANEPAYR